MTEGAHEVYNIVLVIIWKNVLLKLVLAFEIIFSTHHKAYKFADIYKWLY